MKTTQFILTTLFITLFTISNTYPQQKKTQIIPKPVKWEFGLSLGYTTASSFYNINDSLVVSAIYALQDTIKHYTFDFYHTSITLQARYYIEDKFKVFFNMPIGFFELDETYQRDEYGYREAKKQYTLNRIDNLELGISKLWIIGAITTGLAGSVRIPTGFHNGLYDNPDYEFLSDGAMEWHLESEIDVQVKQYSLKNNLAFDLRGEEFENRVIWNAGIGIQTVPNTELKLFSEMHLSTEKFTNQTRPLVPNQEVAQENNYFAGAEFTMLFSREVLAKFGYQVSLAGKNSWKKATAYLQFSYRI